MGEEPQRPTEGAVRADGLELTDAHILKNAVGHYYIVGYLPGGIRVAGWLHERPLPGGTPRESGTKGDPTDVHIA